MSCLAISISSILEQDSIDLCDESEEYHTLLFDGPIFESKINFILQDIISLDKESRFLSMVSRKGHC